MESCYNAAVSEADFSDAATADIINDWCLENTNGLIDQIVDSDSLADQSAVLANALYFLGTWIEPFPDATEGTFYGFDGEMTVDMMHDQVYDYCENDYATAFIKYYYDDYAFIGILPKEEGDFNLAVLDINGLLDSQTDEYDVVIKIPKFTVEYSARLDDALKENGLTDIFSADAIMLMMIQPEKSIELQKMQIFRSEPVTSGHRKLPSSRGSSKDHSEILQQL